MNQTDLRCYISAVLGGIGLFHSYVYTTFSNSTIILSFEHHGFLLPFVVTSELT